MDDKDFDRFLESSEEFRKRLTWAIDAWRKLAIRNKELFEQTLEMFDSRFCDVRYTVVLAFRA